MKEVHRGRAVQIQTMFLGNDPERKKAFIPLMSNEVDLPEPNQIKRIIFKTPKWGWFCFIWMAPQCSQSSKELIQTDLRCSTAEREQKTTKQRKREERGEPPPLSFYIPLVNMSTWFHICYTHPHLPTHTNTHMHGCESTQKHCGVHPGPSQPNFSATPIQACCPHQLSYKTPPTLGPTQSPTQSLKNSPPPQHSPPPSSQLRPLPRALHWQAASATQWMDWRHRNCERKRQRRLISTEWCQIDLFLLSSSMNMAYISIKFNYPLLPILHLYQLYIQRCKYRYYLLFQSCFCSRTADISFILSGL